MSCNRCRVRLLEADPGAIALALGRREGDSMLEREGRSDPLDHLTTCPDCRAAAERLVSANSDLVAGLASLRPAGSTAEAVRRARLESSRRTRRARQRAGWTTVAAACLAGVIALGTWIEEPRGPGAEMVASGELPPSLLPEVESGPDESVMVFESEDESVVVFWFFEGRGQ